MREKVYKKVFHGSISIKINFYDLLLHTGHTKVSESESVNGEESSRRCIYACSEQERKFIVVPHLDSDMDKHIHAATAGCC